ncbi:MAG: hypothetical protein OXU45_03950 [Candidatus Melainabacteria bacterium]|nr:hypothetical protein [Candidatus Melainabacteria bacterium]
MSELGGGQAGGFNTPYNPNLRANNRAQANTAIRRQAPVQEPNTQTDPQAPVTEQPEITTEVEQRRADTQRIQRQVHNDRTAQADSFSSREDAGNARADRVARHVNPEGVQDQQRQHRERLARNINQASVGLQKALDADKPEAAQDQQLASNAAQSQQSLDPDARARKDLNKKLKLIREKGNSQAQNFIRFVESRKGNDGLVDEETMELVNGYYENVQAETSRMTPTEMIDGDHARRFYADKISSDNVDELEAFEKGSVFALAPSMDRLNYVAKMKLSSSKSAVLREAPEYIRTTPEKVSPQQRVISLGIALIGEDTKWAEGSLAGV